jgi:hypothetical protein
MSTVEDIIYENVHGPVTSYVLVATYIDDDGQTNLYFDTSDEQEFHITAGLLKFADVHVNNKISDVLRYNLDQED